MHEPLVSICATCARFCFRPEEAVVTEKITLCIPCLVAFDGGVHMGRVPQEGEYYVDLEAYYVMRSKLSPRKEMIDHEL
jgi:hypothetical protein